MSDSIAKRGIPPHDDPEQSKRFVETAKEIGTDESPEAFERAFGRVLGAKHSAPPSRPSGKPASS